MVKCWVYSLKQTNKLRSKRPRFQLRSGIYHYITIDVDKNLQIPGVGSSEGSRREDGTTVWRLPKPHHSFLPLINILRGFLVELVIKNPPANAGDPGELGSIPGSGRSPGGGHVSPLQFSCLENPMDREAWRAAVHKAAESRTWLKWLSRHTEAVSILWKLINGNLTKTESGGFKRSILMPVPLWVHTAPDRKKRSSHLPQQMTLLDSHQLKKEKFFLFAWQQSSQWKATILRSPSFLQWTFCL